MTFLLLLGITSSYPVGRLRGAGNRVIIIYRRLSAAWSLKSRGTSGTFRGVTLRNCFHWYCFISQISSWQLEKINKRGDFFSWVIGLILSWTFKNSRTLLIPANR